MHDHTAIGSAWARRPLAPAHRCRRPKPAAFPLPAMQPFSGAIAQAISFPRTAAVFGMGLRARRRPHYSSIHPLTHASSTVNLGRNNGVPGLDCVPGAAT
jgi:hypothetical protein